MGRQLRSTEVKRSGPSTGTLTGVARAVRRACPHAKIVLADPTRGLFQSMLFSKIVPNCKKLGLLDANDGWLRKRFDTLGVTQFEDWTDTGEEYELLDEVAKDRDAAASA